jgi:hypothetical protein
VRRDFSFFIITMTEAHTETFLDSIAAVGGHELVQAVEDEFRLGWEREKVMVQMQQNRMAEACTRLESAAVDGMGRVMADVPAASYFYWLHKGRAMGESNLWRHQEFVSDFLRDNPQFAVRYRSAKPRSGWTPEMQSERHGIVLGSKYGLGVAA